MRRIALDDTADDDDSVRFFAVHHHACSVGQFDCSGHMRDGDIVLIHAVLEERLTRTFRHRKRDVAIPIRHYNCIALMFEHISARQYIGIILT